MQVPSWVRPAKDEDEDEDKRRWIRSMDKKGFSEVSLSLSLPVGMKRGFKTITRGWSSAVFRFDVSSKAVLIYSLLRQCAWSVPSSLPSSLLFFSPTQDPVKGSTACRKG